MPRIYKKNCDRCNIFYSGGGKMYCSRVCSDKANGDKIKGKNHPMWGKKHKESSIKIMSDKTKGENNPMFGLKGLNHPAFGKVGHWAGKKRNHPPGEWHPMLGKKHTKEYRDGLSKKRKGKNNPMFGISREKAPNWKGGITSLNQSIRNSLEYREWREKIFKRDNWTCQICKQIGGELNADHIKAFAYNKELRFNVDNGRTLCVPCHKMTGNYGWRAYNEEKLSKS